MNLSVEEIGGEVLAISQFTLYGDASKGRRPSFRHAAEPGHGEALYDAYCHALDVPVARGVFGAQMTIDLEADWPSDNSAAPGGLTLQKWTTRGLLRYLSTYV